MSNNEKGFNNAGKVLLYWMISIGVVGVLVYVLPPSFLMHSIVSDLSKISVGVERWASGSIYPDQMRVVWIYLYLSFPVATLLSFVKLDFSVEFNKNMKAFSNGKFISVLFKISPFLFLAFFMLNLFVYNEGLFFGVMYENGPIYGSFSASLYSGTYVGAVVVGGLFSFCAVLSVNMSLFFYYHFLLRLIKRREL